MTYLLAKYTVLFLLTALFGFALGYWFSRRKFVDVSESYEDLRQANSRSDATQWETLWRRLDAMPTPKEPDFTDVHQRIAGVSSAISSLPRPEPVSFAPIENRLDSLQESIRNIPAPVKPRDPDFQPLIERLDNLEGRVKAIPVPEMPAPVDLTAVTRKIDSVEQAVRNIPEPAPQRDVDLKPVQTELTSLRSALKSLPVVETHEPADLTPVTAHIRSLEQKLSTMPKPQSVDLAPIDRRLTAIEKELGKLRKQPATRQAKERAPRTTHRQEPRILSAALYGKKDDLKLISGVGPKLERVLNKNGVYYFWQVAEWSAQDINVIDERLDAFKGRIARDSWVNQAKQLRRKPDAARMPAE